MKDSLGNVIMLVLFIVAFPLALLVLLVSCFASSKNKVSAPKKENKQDGYDKVFPYIFTDENSSDDEKLLEDLYIMEKLDEDQKK